MYEFELAYLLVMYLLPLAVINFCDDRGRHCAFSQLENWSTAEFAIRAQLFTCAAAIAMFDLMVVPPWTTGAGRYTGKPLLFIDSFSVGQSPRIRAMLAYLPESSDPGAIQAALRVMAVVYVRSGLAPKGMSTYQVFQTMVSLAGFGAHATKNIGLRSSASQGICECSTQLKMGGGAIVTTLIPPGEGGPRATVKIHAAPAQKICNLWNVQGARAVADAEALRWFADTHYRGRAAPWAGGAALIPVADDGAAETSGPSDVTDAATPASEEELTPEFLRTIFLVVSLYAATPKAKREEALTAVGEGVDALRRRDPRAVRALFDEMERARSKERDDGPADLSQIWDEAPRPPWDPESERFLERALEAREGLDMTTRDVPLLYDDDRKLIYNPSSSKGFQELLEQYRKDEGIGEARASLQKNQKLTGSLRAMYQAPAPRARS